MPDLERKHGRIKYYLIGEGFKPDKGEFKEKNIMVRTNESVLEVMVRTNESVEIEDRDPFLFGRMFDIKGSALCRKGIEELALAMIQPKNHKEQTDLAAGYTFLGQFIDHDMSFDNLRRELPVEGEIQDPAKLLSNRSPKLDLDSLYGYYPNAEDGQKFDRRLYEKDGVRMKIGCTSLLPSRGITKTFPFDLPRDNQIAVIGDSRNDSNLGVAQTHLAFLKFHNAVVKLLSTENQELAEQPEELFKQAREMVTRHYQWIILHDFLPEIIDKTILKSVIESAQNGGSGPVWLADNERPFMPVEFSGAAFRLGHSLLQDEYEWNIHFQSPDASIVADPLRHIANLHELFVQTGSRVSTLPNGGASTNPLNGLSTLPGDWMIDWRRFYDFDRYGIDPHPKFNHSRKIDSFITDVLKGLPDFLGFASENVARNLAARNLIRGNFLELPTGQSVAQKLVEKNRLEEKDLLTSDQILEGAHKEILLRHGFETETPLWYYILKEAEVLGENGKRLGGVGSCIVADTFVKLIQRSEVSILKEGWKPTTNHPQIPIPNRSEKEFEMADLLVFANESDLNLLNPSEAKNSPKCSS